MDFELSDEQRQLADSLERLLAQQYGIEQRRAIVASADGFSGEMWARFAELGILSLPVSEAAGGFGGGAVDLMRPMALIGEEMVVEPVLAQLVAARLLEQASVDGARVLPALLPLVRGTLDNLEHLGVGAALTGPIPRGDADTVRLHLARLSAEDRALYCALGLELLRLARQAGLDERRAAEIESLLAPG